MSDGEIGTWVNPKTGVGYSGPRQPGDVPADPVTGEIIFTPSGSATVTEDYTKADAQGEPFQTITISRPIPDPSGETVFHQEVAKTQTGEYIYTETTGPKPPPPQVNITQMELEKSRQVGEQITSPYRPEQIHETATEFDKPPGQISKGVQIGVSSIIQGIGETVIGTPTKVYEKAQELEDQPGKVKTILDLGRLKIEEEARATSKFAIEEPIAFGISTAIQLGFMEVGFRTFKPLMVRPPKMITSIEIGKQFQLPKGSLTKSAIITYAGKEKFVSKVDTFVFSQAGSKLSKGFSTIETSRGLSAPIEYRFGVSGSLNLGKVKPTFETTVPSKTTLVTGSPTAIHEMPVVRFENLFKTKKVWGWTRVYRDPNKRFSGEVFKETLDQGVWKKSPIVLDKSLTGGELDYVIYHEVLHRRFPSWPEKKIVDFSATGQFEKQIMEKIKFTEIEPTGKPVTRFTGLRLTPDGFDFNLAVSRIQEIGPLKKPTSIAKPVGEPTDMLMVGFSKKYPGVTRTITSGISDKGKPSIMSSIIKTEKPGPDLKPFMNIPEVMRPLSGPSKTLSIMKKPVLKQPVEPHITAIATGVEAQIKASSMPKVSSGVLKPIPPQKFDMIIETEVVHTAPIGTLVKPDLASAKLTRTSTLSATLIDQKLERDLIRLPMSGQTKTGKTSQQIKPIAGQITLTKTDVLQQPIQLHKTLQIQKQLQKQVPIKPTKPTTRSFFEMPPPPHIITPPPPVTSRRPSISATKKPIIKKPGSGLIRGFDYTESLASFNLGIKGKKPKKGKLFTGFELRPGFNKKKKR